MIIIRNQIKFYQNYFKGINGNIHNSPWKINIWVFSIYILRIFPVFSYPYQRYHGYCKWCIAYVHTWVYCSFWCSGHKILGRLLLQCIWLWISMIDDSCFFSSTGPVLKARRTSTCRMLGKRERQETVSCFCRPILNCSFSKSAFLCPYFILDVSYPPVFPLFPLHSPHRSCPAFLVVYSVFRNAHDL